MFDRDAIRKALRGVEEPVEPAERARAALRVPKTAAQTPASAPPRPSKGNASPHPAVDPLLIEDAVRAELQHMKSRVVVSVETAEMDLQRARERVEEAREHAAQARHRAAEAVDRERAQTARKNAELAEEKARENAHRLNERYKAFDRAERDRLAHLEQLQGELALAIKNRTGNESYYEHQVAEAEQHVADVRADRLEFEREYDATDGTKYRPTCGCGWEGTATRNAFAASDEARLHEETCTYVDET